MPFNPIKIKFNLLIIAPLNLLKKYAYFLLLLPWLFTFENCRKADTITKDAVSLKFSTDTVFFDTIFSKLGNDPNSPRSVTLQVRVTNPNKNAVNTQISLAGNFYGLFKLNVDGRSGTVFKDIEIRGNDSIYIFVQAYINQVGSNTPFIVADQILFETNGNKQDVDMIAYAQDANYLRDSVLSTGNILWTSDKPYVIYESVLVPTGCTLTLEAGTHIHSYTGSQFIVQGTLIVNGTIDKPVVFEGSRLDDDYKEMPGQWIGIHFIPGSSGNKITGAIVKNAYMGIRIDSMPNTGTYGLELRQSIIKNISAAGILCYTGKLYAENNLVANCGLYSLVGELGGTYNLVHNTFATQSFSTGRKDPGFYLSNSPWKDKGVIVYSFALNFNLKNNIITGSLDDEFFINNDPEGPVIVNKVLNNNLLKTTNKTYEVNGNMLNLDPRFKSVQDADYDLEKNSPCANKGESVGILIDLKNRNRNTSAPSIGAYEVQ